MTAPAMAGAIHRHAAVASTMDEARALAADGAPPFTVVVAAVQTGGRGRSGRAWVSPPGNLHMTVILRPPADARRLPQIAFVAGLAVADAVDALAGPGARLKWPNDVLCQGAKVAGILVETSGDGAVLAGIGMNVASHPADMAYPVTSLRALGSAADADAALSTVLSALQREWAAWLTDGFAPVLRRWQAKGPALGDGLVVRDGAAALAGRFAGLREDGALLLQTLTGTRAVVAGDVQPCATAADVARK